LHVKINRNNKLNVQDLESLEDYVSLENSEIGEYVNSLLDIARFSQPHGMTDEFEKALEKELLHWLERFKSETKIVTFNVPQPDKEVRELVWDE
jgi:hypothetical protein